MAHDIFISYRREDARADAGRLYDRLSTRFGEAHVFMDIEDIEPGENFVHVLDMTLQTCSVMIVLIGKRWLGEGEQGSHRIADRHDFVRLEVEKALERDIQVVPVLVGAATMPAAELLPPALSGLSRRQAFELSDARFHDDVDHLIGLFEDSGPGRAPWFPRAKVALALAGVLLLLVLGTLVLGDRPGEVLRSEPRVLDKSAVLEMLASRGFYDSRWHATGKGPEHRYEAGRHGGDLVVTDRETGLMWQRGGSGRAMPRALAGDFVARLNAARFADHDDWRLPTLEEAMSLNQPAHPSGWHLDPLFEAGPAAFVWTSDHAPSGNGWVVYYLDGLCQSEKPAFNAYVRAVRRAGESGAGLPAN
jgi:hypothetical protein